ncbi:MAG TPA: N-acetyl-gamma-glutamyl-phosphate reductase [Chitinophagales bacterium]|nr:N-acetyl-gamma-glutamyl-phosphate reductase [Chitinophagales bacterium]
MKKIKAGIIGGAGYTGGELIRLLLAHPAVDLAFVQSNSNAGNALHAVFHDMLGLTELAFAANHQTDIDVLFLCGGHDAARKFLTVSNIPAEMVVIDLSQDFRHNQSSKIGERQFVYGLPELNRDKIKTVKSIANPGCFATCIELALLPLASVKLLNTDIHINATTGSTGAGQAPTETTHFSWRSNNLSAYKVFEHQHVKEIGESLAVLQPGFDKEILFVPQRGAFTRGIHASVYMECNLSEQEVIELYNNYYSQHPFVTISPYELDVKQVVNTNRCFLHVLKYGNRVLVTSVIDNLLKGASGQAVQNMNLIFGLPENAGLQLKPSVF